MVWRALIFFLSQAENQLNKNSTLEQAFTWLCQLANRLHLNLKNVEGLSWAADSHKRSFAAQLRTPICGTWMPVAAAEPSGPKSGRRFLSALAT
jgi:hypothetical protein